MELLIIWVITIVASLVMQVAQEMRMFKDIANEGYKIDLKRLTELTSELNPNAIKTIKMGFLIPIANILLVMQRAMQYNNHRHMIGDQLSVMGCLTRMDEEEQDWYNKMPNGLMALLISGNGFSKDTKKITYVDEKGKKTSILTAIRPF